MLSPRPSATAIVGPFVVHSRKGNFGNQDLESSLRMALAHRQEPDVEFVETGSGRRFTCAELIDALDRQDHCPDHVSASPGPPPVAPGLGTFRSYATSTIDLDLDLDLALDRDSAPLVPVPVVAPPPVSTPARRSDRLNKRSDRKRAVAGGNALLIGTALIGMVILGLAAYLVMNPR